MLSTASVVLAAPSPTPMYKAIFWLRPIYKSTRQPVENPYKLLSPHEVVWTYQFSLDNSDQAITIFPEMHVDHCTFQQDNSLKLHHGNIKLGEVLFDSAAWRDFYLLGSPGLKGKFATGRVDVWWNRSDVLMMMMERIKMEEWVTFIPVPSRVPAEQVQASGYPSFGNLVEELHFADSQPEEYNREGWDGKVFNTRSLR
ncbi:hypothetical protein EV360DRAFT_76832 [Lentinula raphanica]|nr:hypothetical protein EV360DRAFT_76832 [Lentinula raphanica]